MTAAISSLIVAMAVSFPGTRNDPSMPAECYEPKAGDIVLFHNAGLKNILFILAGSPHVTHSAIVVARPDGTLAILETPGPAFPSMLSDIPSRLRMYPGTMWVRRLRVPLTEEQSRCLTAFACSQDNKPYDLPGIAIPHFGSPYRRFGHGCVTPEQMDPPRWFCSPLVVAAGVAAGLIDPSRVKLRFTDPQDLKSDRHLDLSPCWEKAVHLKRGERQSRCWWSISCDGTRKCWSDD